MSETRKNILMVGCGRIGEPLGLRLAADGHRLVGLRRRPEPLPVPLETLRFDLASGDALGPRLPFAPDLVYVILTPDRYDDDGYRRTFVSGVQTVLNAIREIAPPPRLVFVSSTSVMGQRRGEIVDESTPSEPASFSGQRLREAEQLVAGSGLPHSVVRFAGIYGPGRERMLRKVSEDAPCRAEPALWTNRIHQEDVVGFLRHLATLPEPETLYLGVDDEPVTQCAVMDWLADAMGRPRPQRISDTPDAGMGKRCRNARLRASGYELRFPTFREGYAAMLREWRGR